MAAPTTTTTTTTVTRHSANPPIAPNFGRDINHDPDAAWNSTFNYLWDQVMVDCGMKFENIGWEDLEGGNSAVVAKNFVDSCRRRPPFSEMASSALR